MNNLRITKIPKILV